MFARVDYYGIVSVHGGAGGSRLLRCLMMPVASQTLMTDDH